MKCQRLWDLQFSEYIDSKKAIGILYFFAHFNKKLVFEICNIGQKRPDTLGFPVRISC